MILLDYTDDANMWTLRTPHGERHWTFFNNEPKHVIRSAILEMITYALTALKAERAFLGLDTEISIYGWINVSSPIWNEDTFVLTVNGEKTDYCLYGGYVAS